MKENYLNCLIIGLAVLLLINATHAVPFAEDSLVEFSCFDDSGCKNYINDSMKVRCDNGKCQCKLLATKQPTDCIAKDSKLTNIISGPCSQQNQCTQPHSECNTEQQVCSCAVNFTVSKDSRRCLPKMVKHGESCELDSQCRISDEFSVCDNGTRMCGCQENHVKINGTCMLASSFACQTNDMCENKGSHLICDVAEKLCVCEVGYVFAVPKNDSNATCLPILKYQDTCLSDEQCQHSQGLGWGAECNKMGICDCNNEHYLRENITSNNEISSKCEPLIVVGQYCRSEEECYQHNLEADEQSMYCSYNECSCKYGSANKTHVICNPKNSNASQKIKINGPFLSIIFLLLIINN